MCIILFLKAILIIVLVYLLIHIDKKNKQLEELNLYCPYQPIKKGHHGGCYGCINQEHYGVEYCDACCFFKAEWNKPNLHYCTLSKRIEKALSNKNIVNTYPSIKDLCWKV